MSWNCMISEERLIDYLDGLLPVDERAEFEAHASSCANCRALVSGVRGVVNGMHRLELIEPPQGLIFHILAETTGKAAKPIRRPALSWFAVFMQPRLALGALSVIATFGILMQATGLNFKKISTADLNPINVLRATNRQVHLNYARGMKFVNDLRVVYEIQSRLQEIPAGESAPAPQRGNPSGRPASPESERQLKNFYELARNFTLTAGLLCTPPVAASRGFGR